jgi:3-isopropylmalate dehydrogenase
MSESCRRILEKRKEENKMSKHIVALGGDGVGPEVTDVAVDILVAMNLGFEIFNPPCGEFAIQKYGTVLPDETKKLCLDADAVLFGAADRKSAPVLVFTMEMDNYVNIRPIKYYPGSGNSVEGSEGIDFVILQGNSEGLYPWGRGDIARLAEKWPEWKDRR